MSICIGLCVFNNGFGLPYIFKNIERIQSLFTEKIQIVIAYDESHDNSLGFIMSKLNDFNIHFTDKNNRPDFAYRNGYICFARNMILKYIRKNIPDTKYLIMMDSNEYACVGDIQLDTFKEILEPERENKWDAVSFDREAGYYDYWALSFDPFAYSFFHTDNRELVLDKMKIKFNLLLENARNTMNFINVYSAFNGFAIYKWSIFKDCNYSIDINLSLFPAQILEKQVVETGVKFIPVLKNAYDCEHRHFHLQAIHTKNAKIRIYPKSLFAKFTGEKMNGCRGPC